MKILCIQGAELFSASINRPNLFYEVLPQDCCTPLSYCRAPPLPLITSVLHEQKASSRIECGTAILHYIAWPACIQVAYKPPAASSASGGGGSKSGSTTDGLSAAIAPWVRTHYPAGESGIVYALTRCVGRRG
jgi:hypothetical protein